VSERALARAGLVVAIAALAAALFVVIGGRGEGSSSRSAPRSAVKQTPVQPVHQTRKTSGSTLDRPGDSAFWRLIQATRRAAGNDTSQQSSLLQDRLTRLSPKAIIAFDRTRHRLDKHLYRWDVWGAAAVIEDGCSDDCFRDFRAYVISLGRGAYERALRDPDSLAPVVQNAESGDWENADNVAPDAYASKTGNDFPLDDSDLSGPPAGRRLNLNRQTLGARYPRLAARFRGS
jgi:Protein of unknown function (DUF4240)